MNYLDIIDKFYQFEKNNDIFNKRRFPLSEIAKHSEGFLEHIEFPHDPKMTINDFGKGPENASSRGRRSIISTRC